MVSEKRLAVLNVALGLVIMVLALHLAGVSLPSYGKVAYALEKGEPQIMVQWKEEFSPCSDIAVCCLAAAQQVSCDRVEGQWRCATGKGTVRYWLNDKAYYYCREQVWWP